MVQLFIVVYAKEAMAKVRLEGLIMFDVNNLRELFFHDIFSI